MPDPAEPFETWLLQRVARAVEAREVSADLLVDLRTEVAATHERHSGGQHNAAVHELAECLGLSVDRLTEMLSALDGQSNMAREFVLRRKPIDNQVNTNIPLHSAKFLCRCPALSPVVKWGGTA